MKKHIKTERMKSLISACVRFIAIVSILFGAGDSYAQTRRKIVKKPAAAAKKNVAEKPLPDLKLPDLNGSEWSLHENRGRVVLINFWATWCAPCRAETPMLVNLGKEYKTRGLEIVGIALDDDVAGNIRKFVADYAVDYPILLPVPGSRLARIDPVPTTLLIDRQGRFYKKYVGAMPEKLLRTDIEKLIKASAAETTTSVKAKSKPAL